MIPESPSAEVVDVEVVTVDHDDERGHALLQVFQLDRLQQAGGVVQSSDFGQCRLILEVTKDQHNGRVIRS